MNKTVAIVGAGLIGLATAAELRGRGISVLQFDRGCIANTVDWFPPGMRFYSSVERLELIGFPVQTARGEKPTREEYLAYLRAFVRHHDLRIQTYEEVLSIEGAKGDFRLHTKKKSGETAEYRAGFVVLAIGSTERPRRLGVPGEDLPHVRRYFDDPHKYYGHRVVIVGGRNSACDAAIQLWHIGAKVTLIHRKGEVDLSHLKYWIHPEIIGMIQRGEVDGRFNTVLTAIEPTAVTTRHLLSGQTDRIECDFVLSLIGYEPDYTLLTQLGVRTQHEQGEPVVRTDTFETEVPGIYCSGTIIAGDQNPYRVFIENAQHHPRIVADAIERERASPT